MVLDTTTTITFPDDPTIPDINMGIVDGTMSVSEILCEGDLNFGEFNASSFEVDLYYDNNIAGKKIQVYQTNNNSESAVFTGIVDSCVRDDHDYFRTLVAYDEAYSKKDINVAKWWNSFWADKNEENYVLTKDIRKSLLNYMGITYIDKELPNDYIKHTTASTYDTLPFGDILTYICQLGCCFPHMNRLGTLEFITLQNIDDASLDYINILPNMYENDNTTFETFETAPITRVQVSSGDNSVSAVVGAEGNMYSLQDNILTAYLDDTQIKNIAENILATCKGIRFTPCNIKMLSSDTSIQLGDVIKIGDVYTYVMSNYLSGQQLIEQEFQIKANQLLESTSFSSNITQQKQIETLYKNNFYSYTYTNTDEIKISNSDNAKTVIKFNLSATAKTDVIFMGMIPIILDEDSNIEISYQKDAMEVSDDTIIKYCSSGYNLINVLNYFTMDENGRLTFTLALKPINTSSDVRDFRARLNAIEDYIQNGVYDTPISSLIPGNITIPANSIKAVAFAKGLATGAEWDGTINIADNFNSISLGDISVANKSDNLNTQLYNDLTNNPTDVFKLIPIASSINLNIANDDVNINFDV